MLTSSVFEDVTGISKISQPKFEQKKFKGDTHDQIGELYSIMQKIRVSGFSAHVLSWVHELSYCLGKPKKSIDRQKGSLNVGNGKLTIVNVRARLALSVVKI